MTTSPSERFDEKFPPEGDTSTWYTIEVNNRTSDSTFDSYDAREDIKIFLLKEVEAEKQHEFRRIRETIMSYEHWTRWERETLEMLFTRLAREDAVPDSGVKE